MSDPAISRLLTSMEGWQLSVGGAMNPAIHHPAWYQLMGIITSEEMNVAFAGRPTSGPVLSSFNWDDLQIACNPTSWTIASINVNDLKRPVEIASALFDKYLPHTPVQSYGFTFSFHAPVKITGNVQDCLAKAMRRASVGLEPPPGSSSRFMHVTPQHMTFLEPSLREPKRIYLYYQTNYTVVPKDDDGGQPDFKPFSIGESLRSQAAKDLDAVRAQLQMTISKIESLEE